VWPAPPPTGERKEGKAIQVSDYIIHRRAARCKPAKLSHKPLYT
jgi:hypothetical protein